MEFVGEGGEVAVPAERVAGEVGELQEQFASAFGVGADEGRDHRERVEDEVRGDLGPKCLDLGLDQAGAGLVQIRQLKLYGDPAGHLSGGPDEDGRLARCAGDQGAVDPVVDGERGDHRPAQRAVGGVAGEPERLAPAGLQGAREPFHDLGPVMVADAVPGEDLLLVGQAQRVGAEQCPQSPGGAAGRLLGEAGAQRGRGEGRGVQGLEGGVLDRGAEPAEALGACGAAAEPEPGGEQR